MEEKMNKVEIWKGLPGDAEVITKEDDAYLIYNRLFALWIRKKYTTEQ